MKRFELFFTFLRLPLDFLMLLLAGLTAYGLRFTHFITAIRPVQFAQNLSWSRFAPALIWTALGWIVIFAFSGLYKINPNRKLSRDLTKVVTACSTGFAAITIYVFFNLQKFDSRFLVLTGWILATLYVIIGRLCLRGIKALLYRAGMGLRRTILIGSEAVAITIAETFTHQPRLGFRIIGHFQHFEPTKLTALLKERPDEIIFTDVRAHETETLAAIDFANQNHITFKYSADLFATISTNISVSTIAGVPIIELRRTRLIGWGRIIKRLMDLLLSLFFLIILSPLLIIISLIIYFETGRPIIYKNERVGQGGKKFLTFKFRSMYQHDSTGEQFGVSGLTALHQEAELIKKQNSKKGPVYKILNDPRVTPVGRFLRRYSLDELLQFWNVLIGEMSLVGPRPHQPREVDRYEKNHTVLLTIKPGITGLAQISGRSSLTFEEEARLDTFYIENWNLFLDIIILFKTPFIALKNKGAW